MITVLLESIIFFGGVYIYAKSTKAINGQGTWGLWIMTGFFTLANAYNLFGGHQKIMSWFCLFRL